MMLALYLVRGHDVGGDNQDWFVVASNPRRATEIWNDHLIENGYPRHHGDMEDALPRRVTTDPANIREVLPGVDGTIYDGDERAVDWESLPMVA